MKKLLLGLLAIGLSFNVHAGGKGNGGDFCEERIIDISNDIKQWIYKGAGKRLVLPESIDAETYSEVMLDAIKHAKVSCTQNKLLIGNAEKSCINFIDNIDSLPRIVCNFDRFNATDESKQYRLIHHEFAGVAQLEVNDGDEESKYHISGQITGFLKDVMIKKLVIMPRTARETMKEDAYGAIIKGDYTAQLFLKCSIYKNNGCIEFKMAHIKHFSDQATVRTLDFINSNDTNLTGAINKNEIDHHERLMKDRYGKISYHTLNAIETIHPIIGMPLSLPTMAITFILDIFSAPIIAIQNSNTPMDPALTLKIEEAMAELLNPNSSGHSLEIDTEVFNIIVRSLFSTSKY